MDMQFLVKNLAKAMGDGDLSITILEDRIEFIRPEKQGPRLPFFTKFVENKETGGLLEVYTLNAASLAGEKWFAPPHSGFQHDPIRKEIWYFYCGELWVLKPESGKLILFERK